jgi:hypothetical protein
MAGSRTLKLSILADVSNLTKGLNGGTKEVQSFGDKIGAFGKKAALAFAAAGVAAAAFTVKFAKDAIVAGEAASTANARIEQINSSMGLFGKSVDVVNDRLVAYAEKTARLTGVDTNSIKATQAKLLTFKEIAVSADEIGGAFDRATMAAIDLAAAGFGSAEGNAVQLGKALNDPIKGLASLSKSGVTFTEIEKARIKTLVESNKVGEAQALILAAIEAQVGDTAFATANATDRMKIGFQQVTERIGIALLPILEKVTTFLLDVMFPAFERYVLPVVEKLTKAFTGSQGSLSSSLTEVVGNIKNFVLPIFKGVVSAFSSVFNAIKENSATFLEFGKIISTYVAPVLSTVLGGALTVVGKIAGGVIDVIASVIKVINGLITGAIKGINLLIGAYNAVPFLPNVSKIALPSMSQPTVSGSSVIASVPALSGGSSVPSISAPAAAAAAASSAGISAAASSGAAASKSTTNFVRDIFRAPTLGELNKAEDARFNAADIFRAPTSGDRQTINLTVNQGIVGDQQSAARAIVDVLNESNYAGTLGADGFR